MMTTGVGGVSFFKASVPAATNPVPMGAALAAALLASSFITTGLGDGDGDGGDDCATGGIVPDGGCDAAGAASAPLLATVSARTATTR